jgi:mTERF
MITSLPAILGYAIDSIRGKLDDLKSLGFDNPVKMITSQPAILGYAIDSIRGKLDDLKSLGFDNPVKMITSSPAILGLAIERIRITAAVIAKLDDGAENRFVQLVKMRRSIIDAAASADCRCWADVRAIIYAAAPAKLRRAA